MTQDYAPQDSLAMSDSHFMIRWIDCEHETCRPADPRYPNGRDINNAATDLAAACTVKLPYPAKRAGQYRVVCTRCGLYILCATAGRADDPRSLRLACRPLPPA